MSDYSHFTLRNCSENVTFKSRSAMGKQLPAPDDAVRHAQHLREGYDAALASFRLKKEALPDGANAASGVYVDVTVRRDAPLSTWNSLDTKKGAKIMNMRSVDETTDRVTLYLAEKSVDWLDKQIEAYESSENTEKRKRRSLVDALNDVDSISLASFFTVEGEFETVNDNPAEYELWIAGMQNDVDDIKSRLASVNIEYRNRVIVFDNVTVVLVKANRGQLEKLPQVLDLISEIRKFKRPSILTNPSGGLSEAREWERLIRECMPVENNPLTKIGILDSGVNYNHPLISPFLTKERCHSVLADGNIRDIANHGTGVAGLVLYGDFTEVLHDNNIRPVTNELVSVKVIANSTNPDATDEHTAIILEDAIRQSEEDGANLMTMTVTSEECNNAVASATSAAIDETLYNGGDPESLLFISAGNISNNDGVDYPDFLWNNPVQDPAQSWNAISVGAFTDKVLIDDVEYEGKRIVAPRGGVSPFSRTSRLWDNNMPIKPEILMEGGNAYWDGEGFSWHDDLMLVTASSREIAPFNAFNATSAATALAGRLAGAIKYHNPELSALSIRALMVHSASWTEAMKQMCMDNGQLNKDLLVHTCGYGVPDWGKATATHESYVTFVAEEELHPFAISGSGLKHANMHFFNLPWPRELLLDMGDVEVTMRVTLSYYIQPAPGVKEKLKKFSYPSELLRFEVSTSQDTEESFKKRVANTAEEDDEVLSNDTSRWEIGIQRRNQGSIHSDSIKETAAQIAAYNMIAVYPATGWWKNRKSMLEKGIKYSLVVSLEAPGVDLYTPISLIVANTITVAND